VEADRSFAPGRSAAAQGGRDGTAASRSDEDVKGRHEVVEAVVPSDGGVAPPPTVVRDVVHDRGEYSFRVDGVIGERSVRFWGDVPAPPAPAAEPAFAATLLPAMAAGGRLELPLALDSRLREALPDLQAALIGIAGSGPYAPLPVRAVEIVDSERPAARDVEAAGSRGVGLFFSGGVDSWSTLLRRPEVTDLIYVHGFDIPLDRPDLSERVEQGLRGVADARGLAFHVVRSNLRDLHDRAVGWEIGHGPGLAAVAHLFAPACRRMLIGSGVTYTEPVTRGSHPLVDHLWSSELCEIVNDGSHLTRAMKVREIAASPEALAVLRVCWRRVEEYNCGRCEKCLRTMVALEAAGALGRCATFEGALDLDAVAALQLPSRELIPWWQDNLALASESGHADLVAALERCLESNSRRLSTERGDSPASGGAHAAAEAQAAILSEQLRAVTASRSWRWTAPLRGAGGLARRLSGRQGGG
jgi:hypothetical protein